MPECAGHTAHASCILAEVSRLLSSVDAWGFQPTLPVERSEVEQSDKWLVLLPGSGHTLNRAVTLAVVLAWLCTTMQSRVWHIRIAFAPRMSLIGQTDYVQVTARLQTAWL